MHLTMTGAMTDITDNEWTDGDFSGISCMFFSPLLPGNFNGFPADGDRVIDVLPDGLTDESNDVWMEGNFPWSWTFRKKFLGILMGIFTMNLADGWTDGTDDRCTRGQTDFQVESHLGWLTDKPCD